MFPGIPREAGGGVSGLDGSRAEPVRILPVPAAFARLSGDAASGTGTGGLRLASRVAGTARDDGAGERMEEETRRAVYLRMPGLGLFRRSWRSLRGLRLGLWMIKVPLPMYSA